MVSTRFQNAERTGPAGIGASASTGFTICGWVNWHTAVYAPVVSLFPASGYPVAQLISIGNRVFLSDWSSGFDASDDTWYFFVVTISSNTATFRLSTDGETLGSGVTFAMGSGWALDHVSLGGYESDGDFLADGQLHHVRAFADTLTDEEILAELTSTSATGSPWAAWELEDASLQDATANDRDLTGSGGTISVGTSSAPVIEKTDYNAIMMGSCF